MATRKMLARILALTVSLGMSAFLLSSCFAIVEASETPETQSIEYIEDEIEGLVVISKQTYFAGRKYWRQYILYDPDTFVMYSFIYADSGSAMTVLYNKYGTPKLYNPEE